MASEKIVMILVSWLTKEFHPPKCGYKNDPVLFNANTGQ